MRVIVIGNGTVGSAVQATLNQAGLDVVPVGYRSGDYRADLANKASLDKLFADLGSFDAVACAAGEVFPGLLEQASDEQWMNSILSKGMGQINLVRAALPYIADRGSFTLISGVLPDEVIHAGVIGATVNHLVEGFVKSAAPELPRGLRINCVSPTVLEESTAFHPYFPGFPPVPAAEVARAYFRSISTPMTGRIIKLHNVESR